MNKQYSDEDKGTVNKKCSQIMTLNENHETFPVLHANFCSLLKPEQCFCTGSISLHGRKSTKKKSQQSIRGVSKTQKRIATLVLHDTSPHTKATHVQNVFTAPSGMRVILSGMLYCKLHRILLYLNCYSHSKKKKSLYPTAFFFF